MYTQNKIVFGKQDKICKDLMLEDKSKIQFKIIPNVFEIIFSFLE